MKRYAILALALVLGCTILTGCRRGTNAVTVPPTTQAATERPTVNTTPTTTPTMPIVTEPHTEAATNETTETATGETHSPVRKLDPNMR